MLPRVWLLRYRFILPDYKLDIESICSVGRDGKGGRVGLAGRERRDDKDRGAYAAMAAR